MCGRFTLRTPLPILIERFHLDSAPDLLPRFNIAPTQDIPVVRWEADLAARQMSMMHWGLIPSWAKDPAIGTRMINARSETAASKPSFRSAFRRRRCLIATDGYYEWQRQGKAKQPFWIHQPSEEPFAMAGLWETWRPAKDADVIESCTILTMAANARTEGIHDRMPVILDADAWPMWLDPELQEPAAIESLIAAASELELELTPVSTYVNNARHEGPECLSVA